MAASSRGDIFNTSLPSTSRPPLMRVERSGCSRMMERSVTLLPEPDSPISATTWPCATLRLTPLTARISLLGAKNSTRKSRREIMSCITELTGDGKQGGGFGFMAQAGHAMAAGIAGEQRRALAADRLRQGATGVEATTCGRI